MPELRFTGPPDKSSVRAKGDVTDPDAPDVVASTEPDDDLSDYIVPPDPEPISEEVLESAPVERPAVASEPSAKPSESPSPTTADTELVRRLEAELEAARARLSEKVVDPSSWPTTAPLAAPKSGEKILIHVRKDGFTACGRVWYMGQELEFTVGADNWKSTVDRSGKSFLQLDESDQIRRYGEVMFGFGPWPGKPWADERAAAAEAARGREAPSIAKLAQRVDNKQTSVVL